MVISENKVREYQRRLILSRMRLLNKNGFYGLLLMHAGFALEEDVKTAATDGKKIYFAPSFMEELSDSELDFVLMHEVLHMALKHCFRGDNFDQEIFNVACDIVVNSNILYSNNMDYDSITIKNYGEGMHLTPNGDEGYKYTAEQVYLMLQKGGGNVGKSGKNASDDSGKKNDDNQHASASNGNNKQNKNGGNSQKKPSADRCKSGNAAIDNHQKWGSIDDSIQYDWDSWTEAAAQAMAVRESYGCVPFSIERMLDQIRNPQIDWRIILQDFVQEEVCDYSFTPPDRRYDGDFFLPDFNEKEDSAKDILFMIDTSASMSNQMVSTVYNEVKSAIDQFNGRLVGWLGFFDAAVVPPTPFENEEEFSIIKAYGGGGTSFHVIFKYIFDNMLNKLPSSIIILTDGYAPIPKEEIARDIPVLWVLIDSAVKPGWGKIARIES